MEQENGGCFVGAVEMVATLLLDRLVFVFKHFTKLSACTECQKHVLASLVHR